LIIRKEGKIILTVYLTLALIISILFITINIEIFSNYDIDENLRQFLINIQKLISVLGFGIINLLIGRFDYILWKNGAVQLEDDGLKLPIDLVNDLTADEKILYLSEELSREKQRLKTRAIAHQITGVILLILFISLTYIFNPFDAFRSSQGVDIGIIVSMILFLIFPLIILMVASANVEREIYYIIITDKKFHLYNYFYWERTGYLYTIDINDVQNISFSRGFPYRRLGSMNFIYSLPETFFLSWQHIPRIKFLQKFIESIILEYGNILKRWKDAKEKLNIEFPHTIKSVRGAVITLEQENIYLKKKNQEERYPLDETFSIDYKNYDVKWGWSIKSVEWDRHFDGFKIYSLKDKKVKLEFGPVEDFVETFDTFYCYLIKWKSENRFLFSKESIENLGYIENNEERMRKQEQIQKISDYLKKRNTTILSKTELSEDSTKPFKKYLQEGEKILDYFKPGARVLKRRFNMLRVFIFGWVIIIISFIFDIFPVFPYLYILFIPWIGFTFYIIIMMIMDFSGQVKHKSVSYILTNKRIIKKYFGRPKFASYSNFYHIGHMYIRKNSYEITISTKNPDKLRDSSMLDIYDIPESNNLLEKILYLKNKF